MSVIVAGLIGFGFGIPVGISLACLVFLADLWRLSSRVKEFERLHQAELRRLRIVADQCQQEGR